MELRRRPDTPHGQLPEHIEPGDFWRILNEDGTARVSEDPENLTGGCWHIAIPWPEPDATKGYALAWLEHHTVREHEDGTISVRPGDGSSNSILVTGAQGRRWHGYINHGVLEPD